MVHIRFISNTNILPQPVLFGSKTIVLETQEGLANVRLAAEAFQNQNEDNYTKYMQKAIKAETCRPQTIELVRAEPEQDGYALFV